MDTPPRKRTYLGDGLYHEYDGYQHYLITPRPGGEHFVALEPEVLDAFIKQVEKIHRIKFSVSRTDETLGDLD